MEGKRSVYRLTYYLEQRGLLSKCQSGFHKGRSTVDALVKVSDDAEKAVMKAIMAKLHFDIEKAYDSLWREGLLIKMHEIGIGGRLCN